MVSSAGVERNAKIGDDEERRKADIPIVQLNPGGVLNHKSVASAGLVGGARTGGSWGCVEGGRERGRGTGKEGIQGCAPGAVAPVWGYAGGERGPRGRGKGFPPPAQRRAAVEQRGELKTRTHPPTHPPTLGCLSSVPCSCTPPRAPRPCHTRLAPLPSLSLALRRYAGEIAVRSSGLPYLVIRPTGLTQEAEGGPFQLEARQGDLISGMLSRAELAALVAAAAGSPVAAGKTFEVRRAVAADVGWAEAGPRDALRLLLGCAPDTQRQQVGLEPFPAPVAPPLPVTQERKKEILADVRVVKSLAAGRGGRVRGAEEAAAADSITATDDGRAALAPAAPAAAVAAGAGGEVPVNVREARAWIDAWKRKRVAAGGGPGVPENVREVREWIRKWRAANLEKQLPHDVSARQ